MGPDVELVTLWVALGLALLVYCGIEETIALLAFDYQGQFDESGTGAAQVYFALCLTLLVIAWPVVLMEMVRGNQQR